MSISSAEVLSRKPKNIAIQTNPEHQLNIVEVDVPEPGPDACLVHIRATGICGSDVHFWKTGAIGDSIVKHNLGLGHESSGTVVKVGKDVKHLKIGDMVALECGIPCSKPTCESCRTGRYNACPDIIFKSSPPVDGTLCRYHVHPVSLLLVSTFRLRHLLTVVTNFFFLSGSLAPQAS